MSYVFFFIYLFLFSWLLTKSRFIAKAGLSSKIIIALFILKVFTGCVHLWILQNLETSIDTLSFNNEGLVEYHLLLNNTTEYFRNFFTSGYSTGYGEVFSSVNSYWNDLAGLIIIKFLSVCDIFSLGNYSINVIFYNFVIFFGTVALYRVYNFIYVNKSNLLIIGCFLLPSLLFYSSTIHKEGLIFAAAGLLIFNVHQAIHKTGFTFVRIVYILLVSCFIFLLRNYVLIALLPALFSWIICYKKKYPPLKTFIIIYLVCGIVFFNAGLLSYKLNLPQSIANKQLAFKQLTNASTLIKLNPLLSTFKSFLINFPQACNHILLRPTFADLHLTIFLLPLCLELFLYHLLFLLFIFFRDKKITKDPFIVFGYFFSISLLIIIGYTIPIIGAIVRYRSIYLPFILVPVLCNINWLKIIAIIKVKKKLY